jgi:hypothetical protein
MSERANIDPKFLARLGLTALALIGIALWFLYDGAITYPRQRERALVYQELKDKDQLDKWEEIAEQNGWSTEDPGNPKEKVDFYIQFGFAGLLGVPGLCFLARYFRARGRWIEADETGLRTSWGQQLEFGQIVSLDKKKWRSKGIANILYEQDGRKRRLVLDDWKFDADPTKAILLAVEARVDVDQIVGGPPEPPPEEEHEEADPAAGEEADSAPRDEPT